MREVLRTTDLVRLSWFQALLSERGIQSIVLDGHTSVIEGSVSAIPRRLMVREEDLGAALRILDESGELGGERPASATDSLLGGRISLLQPESGYRVAIDPVLLAAAVPVARRGPVLDLGCGVGAAALCYAERVAQVGVVGLELDPRMAHLARENVRLNAMEERVQIRSGNLLSPPADLEPGSFEQVMANPPHLPPERADLRADPVDKAATVEGDARLADWIDACLAMVMPKGGITLIHRADRLDEILCLLRGKAGGIIVFPLWPRMGEDDHPGDARRVIVHARTGVRTPLRLSGGLLLHRVDGGYTDAAEAILRNAAAIAL